ncbi:hypothetical protein BUE80_DR002771 [Diplocarpon rosae]|nr:hypothetical protein BUE80_DR002771 [Diplocarpon rosae]
MTPINSLTKLSTPAASSQDDKLEATFAKLSKLLMKGEQTGGPISLLPLIAESKKVLSAYRTKSKSIHEICVAEFLKRLEDGDKNLCTRLDPTTFAFVVDVILQNVEGKEAERGLYLLAASLFHESVCLEDDDEEALAALEDRKDAIGDECILALLVSLHGDDTSFEMRRWERDEILRIIYARLIQTMFREGTPLESLFPVHYDESLYADFPPASQSNIGWGQQLQIFLDNLLPKFNRESNGAFFFTTFVRMVPEGQIGSTNHNCNLFIDQYQLTLLAPSEENNFDSILDIPLELIKRITMLENTDSQEESERITLDFYKDKGKCFLNSQPITLEKAQFSIAKSCLDDFMVLLQKNECDSVFAKNSSLAIQSQRSKKTSYSQLTSESPIQNLHGLGKGPNAIPTAPIASEQKSAYAILTESEDVLEESPVEERIRRGATTWPKSQVATKISRYIDKSIVGDPEYHDAAEKPATADDDLYGASPKRMQPKPSGPKALDAKVVPAISRKPKVKPQAKKPIKFPHSTGKQTQKIISSKNEFIGDDYDEPGKLDKAVLQQNAKPALKKVPAENKKTRAKRTSQIAESGKKTTAATGQKFVMQKQEEEEEGVFELKDSATPEKQSASHTKKADYHATSNSFDLPDVHDAPTLRAVTSIKPPKLIAKAIESHPTKSKNNKSAEEEAKRKRYSMNAPTASTIQAVELASDTVFDMPEDDHFLTPIHKVSKVTAKAKKSKEAAPAAKVFKKAVNSKKQQSAPAAFLPAAGTRNSQRTAAYKARDKMRGADESQHGAELEVETEEAQKAGPKTKSKSQAIYSEKTVSENISEDPRKAERVDAKPMAPVTDQGNHEDLYNLKPQKSAKTPKQLVISGNLIAPAAIIRKKTRKSALDFTDKLNNAIDVLSSDTDCSNPQQDIQLTMNSKNLVPSKSPKFSLGSRDTSMQTTRDGPAEVFKQLENEKKVDESSSLQKSTNKSSPMEVDDSPIPLVPEIIRTDMAQSQVDGSSNVISKQVSVCATEDLDDVSVDQNVREIAMVCVETDLTTSLQQAAPYGEEEHILIDQPKKRKMNGVLPVPAKRHHTEKGEIDAPEPVIEHTSSARKDVDRKPRVIEFGRQGAQNQGVTTGVAQMSNPKPAVNLNCASPANLLNDRKRKRAKDILADELSPPKRLDSSPAHAMIGDHLYSENMEIDLATVESSPPVVGIRSKAVRRRANSRHSSQPSRVDDKGSPIATENPIDHIHKLKERLAEPLTNKLIQLQEPTVESSLSPPQRRDRRFSQIFGPTISLGNKLKARPSSPRERNSRYVPHEKTNNGTYNAVGSKKVIEPKVNLVDPFIEQARKPTGFAERLHSSASKEQIQTNADYRLQRNAGGSPTARVHGAAISRHQVQQALPELPRESPSSNTRQKRRSHPGTARRLAESYQQSIHTDRNRRHEYDISMHSDMSTGSSSDSRSSECVITPLQERDNERWNVALRPHYNAAGQAVHRIADEMLIRLSEEEDKMDLLVGQYKESGTKILNSLAKNRGDERSLIARNLNDKKAAMASTFSSARNIIKDTIGNLKENPASQIERDWRKDQEITRKQISEGRKIS